MRDKKQNRQWAFTVDVMDRPAAASRAERWQATICVDDLGILVERRGSSRDQACQRAQDTLLQRLGSLLRTAEMGPICGVSFYFSDEPYKDVTFS